MNQDHPMYGEMADTIQAALVIWSHGDTAAAVGCVDLAIGRASDAGDLMLVDGLKRLRSDIESECQRTTPCSSRSPENAWSAGGLASSLPPYHGGSRIEKGKQVQWYKFNLTGVDHLADCPHMVDTPGWPHEPWGKQELSTPVTDLTNPCATCLSREEKATAGYTYRDGLTAQERFLASRKRK